MVPAATVAPSLQPEINPAATQIAIRKQARMPHILP
jgi:hypothetical protein